MASVTLAKMTPAAGRSRMEPGEVGNGSATCSYGKFQKTEFRAKDLLKRRQADGVGESAGLAEPLREVTLAYCGDGTAADERSRAIGTLLEPDLEKLIRRREEQVALATRNHFRLMPNPIGTRETHFCCFWSNFRLLRPPKIGFWSKRFSLSWSIAAALMSELFHGGPGS